MAENGEVEVCRSFRNTGRCRFGEDCKFEHTDGDAIPQPARRERGECFNFRDYGECAHGDRCRFNHGPEDTRGDDRTQEVCRNFLRGRCANGDDCVRKHEGTPEEPKPRRRSPRAKGVCFAFRDEGECERGEDCQFAHGEADAGAEEGESRPRRVRAPRAPRAEGDAAPRKRKPAGECFAFRDNGECERGEECRFTHGGEETYDDAAPTGARRPRRSPGVCFAFRDNGECERGEECRFVHGEVADEDGAPAEARKPRKPRTVVKLDEICNNFKAGKCRLGDRCRRIHEEGTEEQA